ncbi:helix-turn-helix domain-containing protein [Isoptericola sp. NPDC056578]|uniref:helix-turn-helix domain-containing protein n=1 Tax=unclassified Isoptericola TaxID=2623355 RepID=UPI0036BD4438
MRSAELSALIGERLTAARAVRGLSLGALARAAGIGKGSLSEIEAGSRNPNLATLYALAGALDVPMSWLLAEQAGAEVSSPGIRTRLLAATQADDATVEVYALRLDPGTMHRSEAHGAHVTEHLLVTRGRAEVGPLDAPAELATGESLRWRADSRHGYRALDDAPAEAVLTMWWRPIDAR